MAGSSHGAPFKMRGAPYASPAKTEGHGGLEGHTHDDDIDYPGKQEPGKPKGYIESEATQNLRAAEPTDKDSQAWKNWKKEMDAAHTRSVEGVESGKYSK